MFFFYQFADKLMKWSGSIKEQQMEILKHSTSTQVQYLSKCEEANAPPLQLMVE